jgi:hypothetical protein
MGRGTAGTRTGRIKKITPTGNYGTSSDLDPNSNFQGPEDLSDVAGINIEVDSGKRAAPRRPPRGGIDLGKGLDLEKPRQPRSSIGIDIGKSPQGNLGIGVELPTPVPGLGARGGISIDPRTGKIRGGSAGIGIGKGPIGGSIDIGVDTPPGSDKIGCFKYVTFTLGPFSHTYGKNECEPPKPKPKGEGEEDEDDEDFTLSCQWVANYRTQVKITRKGESTITGPSDSLRIPTTYKKEIKDTPFGPQEFWVGYTGIWIEKKGGMAVKINPVVAGYTENTDYQVVGSEIISWVRIGKWDFEKTGDSYAYVNPIERNSKDPVPSCKYEDPDTGLDLDRQLYPEVLPPDPSPTKNPESENPNPPVPNPLPRKRDMDNDCCKTSIVLQLEILRLLGREIGPNGLPPQTDKKGFIGEEFERTKTPIEKPEKPEKIKIAFTTLYDLLVYIFKQANNLDTALDPQSYRLPTGYVQNPKYSRDSEQSLKTNIQPDKDKAGNKRELEINKDEDVRMSGFLQQQAYAFQMLRRLEYLFPSGELDDALIAKTLLIPGAEGNIKIHNMLMAWELQMQYLNATIGNPREVLTIKDANPALAGDQPVEIKALTIADWLRQVIKFQIDTGGDVDNLVNLELRDFRTGLANRTDIIKTAEMVQALFEDSGMREQQHYIPLHLEGDPYAGQWIKGEGFKSNPDLEKKTEEATEKVLRETMKPTEIKIKVSRRHKDEKTDMRDLLRGLADFFQRLLSVPTAGDAAKAIDKLVESAKFKVQTDMALIRQNVAQAASASRNRTKKRKK